MLTRNPEAPQVSLGPAHSTQQKENREVKACGTINSQGHFCAAPGSDLWGRDRGPGLKDCEGNCQAGVANIAFGVWQPEEVQLCTLAETSMDPPLCTLRPAQTLLSTWTLLSTLAETSTDPPVCTLAEISMDLPLCTSDSNLQKRTSEKCPDKVRSYLQGTWHWAWHMYMVL